MRWLFVLVSCATTLFGADTQEPSPAESPMLPWTTDFDKGIEIAKTQNLPLYVYFTGSSWCIWCKRMDREIHNQDNFRQKMVCNFIFVKIDLPAGGQADDRTKDLLSTYNVRGVPTVVILNPHGQELARFRYQQIPPEQYADLVLQSITKGAVSSEAPPAPPQKH